MQKTTKQKHRILVLTSTFPRWENDTDPKFVYDLARRLTKQFDVDILAPHYKGIPTHERINDLNVYRFKYFITNYQKLAYDGGILPNIKKQPILTILIPFFIASQTWNIFRLIRKNNYHAIHAHWLIPQGLSLYILSKIHRKAKHSNIVLTSHGGDLFSLNMPGLKILKKNILLLAQHVTVVSSAMKEKAISLGIKSEKISINPMGVDLENKFTPTYQDKKKNIIFTGRLVEKKGVEFLIKAMNKIVKQHKEAHLTIIGDGPLKNELKQLSSSLNLNNNISFLGAIPNNDIPSYLQKSLIAVIPSIITKSGDQEGLGLTIIEAMGCECITIASKLPAIKDIIKDNHNGFLVEQQNSSDIASLIQHILKNANECQKIASQGRVDVIQNFDWDKVTLSYIKLFNQLNSRDH